MVHRLRPGDALCFNNRRMAHSRNAFQLNGGERHLRVSLLMLMTVCISLAGLNEFAICYASEIVVLEIS